MLKFRNQADFLAKIAKCLPGQNMGVGNFECHRNAFDRIARLIDRGKSSLGEASFNDVFSKALPSTKHRDDRTSVNVNVGASRREKRDPRKTQRHTFRFSLPAPVWVRGLPLPKIFSKRSSAVITRITYPTSERLRTAPYAVNPNAPSSIRTSVPIRASWPALPVLLWWLRLYGSGPPNRVRA